MRTILGATSATSGGDMTGGKERHRVGVRNPEDIDEERIDVDEVEGDNRTRASARFGLRTFFAPPAIVIRLDNLRE